MVREIASWLTLFVLLGVFIWWSGADYGRQRAIQESQARAQWAQVYWARRAFYVQKEVIREQWELWHKGIHMWSCPDHPGCRCKDDE